MKKFLAVLLISLGLTTASVSPSQAQWGGCWTCGGWGGYGWGGGYGVGLGIGLGAAIAGGAIAGAIANGGGYGYGYGYAPYYAVPAVPVYRSYRYNAPVYYYDYYGY